MGIFCWLLVVLGLVRRPGWSGAAGLAKRIGLAATTTATALVRATAAGGLAFVLVAAPAIAEALPARTGWVTDEVHALTPKARQELEQELEDFAQKTSFELVVVAIRSLGGQSIEDYGYELGRSWKVGKAGQDSGVVVLVAVDDHKMRIETGKGVGEQLTDLESRDILDRVMKPRLQARDTAGALREGARAVMAKLGRSPGEAKVDAKGQGRPWWHWVLGWFAFMLLARLAVKVISTVSDWFNDRASVRRTTEKVLAKASEALPSEEEFQRLLARLHEKPWNQYPEIASSTHERYAKSFAALTSSHESAAREAIAGPPHTRVADATQARLSAERCRNVLDHLRLTTEKPGNENFIELIGSLQEARALLARLKEEKIEVDEASQELMRDGEEMLSQALAPEGPPPRELLPRARVALARLLGLWREREESLARQSERLATLARDLETTTTTTASGQSVYQLFRHDFPAEQEGQSPQESLAAARASLERARSRRGDRSPEAIDAFRLAARDADTHLSRARSAADEAHSLAARRGSRQQEATRILEEARSLLGAIRLLPSPPQDLIARVHPLLESARAQINLGSAGNLVRALEDATRARDLCTAFNHRTASPPDSSSDDSYGGSSEESSSDDSGSSGESYDGGYDSGGSSGGGDFGGGGSSSDW
jgi:uncharacterized protein